MSENGRPLPKFGEWDVNNPESAEAYTVIFNKARNEKKAGDKPDSVETSTKQVVEPVKSPRAKKRFCCF